MATAPLTLSCPPTDIITTLALTILTSWQEIAFATAVPETVRKRAGTGD